MKYLNFELSVDALGDGAFEVRCRSPSGEAKSRLILPSEADELPRWLRELEQAIEHSRAARTIVRREGAPSPPQNAVTKILGTALFNAILNGRVLERYRASLAIAATLQAGLRIQLRLEPPEVAALPWEFMYDPDDGSFVSLNPNTPVVRYPEIGEALRPLVIEPPLRILGLMASPSSLSQLDKAGEVRRIEEALTDLKARGEVKLQWVQGGTFRDLQAALPKREWHVLHYIGHGGFDPSADGGGFLALENEGLQSATRAGSVRRVSAAALGRMLRGYPSLRLVVLNSCLGARASDADAFSSVSATLVRKGVPAVVAMQYEISDQAAVAFGRAFYASLASGVPVDRAVTDARSDLHAQREDSLEWGTPVLLMRSPDGVLFAGASGEVTTGPTKPSPPPPPPSRRPIPIAMILAGVLAPVLLAGALAARPAPEADVTFDAQVTGVGVTLPREWVLPDAFEVSRLGVSGLSRVTLSTSSSGRRSVEGDAVQLRALDEGQARGRLTLDLKAIAPPGSRFSLSTADSGYAIKIDSLASFTVPTSGPVQVIVPALINERVDFGLSGSVGVRSRGRVLRLDFRPAKGTRARVAERLPFDRLDLTRVDQYRSDGRTEPRIVSTIRGGTIAVAGAGSWSLAEQEELHASRIQGEVRALELAGNHLRLQLAARAQGLRTGPDSASRSLMPSRLGWTVSTYPVAVAAALVLYLVLLALAIRRRMRTAPAKHLAALGSLAVLLAAGRPAAAQSSRPAPEEARALVVRVVSGENGAGIIVGADGARIYIATAKHVVRSAARRGVVVYTHDRPKDAIEAALSDTAEGVDIAVITIARASLPRLPEFDRRGNPRRLGYNHAVSPMGCPRGVCWAVPAPPDRVIGTDRQGIIFQSALVSPGSSGGALFNEYWEVVGMVTKDQPPRANAVDIDEVLDHVDAFGHPASLRRANVPREGFPIYVGGLLLTRTSKNTEKLGLEPRFPGGRLVATRRGRTYGLTWHLSGLRLAPRNLVVSAAMGGVDLDFHWGRFTAQPFFEIGIGSVEGRFDAGGYEVAGENGPRYVPVWQQEKQDGLGLGGGMSVLVALVSHASLEVLAGHWSFRLPERVPRLPTLFVGAGLRWGL